MKIYFRILQYIKPYNKHFFLSILFLVLYSIFSGLSIYLLIPLLETLFNETTVPNIVVSNSNFFSNIIFYFKNLFYQLVFVGNKMESLFRISVVIIFAFFFKTLFGYAQAYLIANIEQGIVKDIRNSVYTHLHSLSLEYFTNEKSGNLISRVVNDVNVINNGLTQSFVNLFREPILIMVFLGIAISISWQLTLFAILTFPFTLFAIKKIGTKLHKESAISQENMSNIFTILQETIQGIKIVKSFAMEKFEIQKFKKATDKFFISSRRISRLNKLAHPITELLSIMAVIIVILYGGNLVLVQKSISASEFIGFIMAVFQILPPIKELSQLNNRIQESTAAGKRVFEILDTIPKIKDEKNAIEIKNFDSQIEFKNVWFAYENINLNDTKWILNDVSFNVNKGEIVALVGSSGAGKTTIADLIPRFFDIQKGAILVNGIDIKNLQINSLRNQIGIVTQESILFNDTIKNNIAYGEKFISEEKIIDASKIANAFDFISQLPKKIETEIGDRGVKLSGGQRQRIAIARAILKNTPILILDEATSSLDTESEILVQQAIDNLMKDRTTIVIAHRLSTIQKANKIIVIDDGKIVETGLHNELIQKENGVYKKLYELQFRG